MGVNEKQRREYLEAMGIELYYPRFVLPNAQPSSRVVWPQKTDGPQSNNSKRDRQAPEPIVKPSIDTETSFSSKQEEETRVDEITESLRFSLGFISLNEQIAILNELPYARKTSTGHQRVKLLTNLVKALDFQISDTDLQEKIFDWPIADTRLLQQGKDAATQSLKAFLERRHSEHGFKVLILLGLKSVEFACPDRLLKEVRGTLQQPEQIPWQVIASHSLDEMLALPHLKKEAWRNLQNLHSRSDY